MNPEEEEQFYLWSCLTALRRYIPAETYEEIEKAIGLAPEATRKYAPPQDNRPLPF